MFKKNKNFCPEKQKFLLYPFFLVAYAGLIALVGQASAHVPQSVHVSGSIL
jgi:hypothetical protein